MNRILTALILALLLMTSTAYAGSLLGNDGNNRDVVQGALNPNIPHTLSYSGSAANMSFLSTTIHVRIMCTTDCFFLIGSNTAATSTNGCFLPAYTLEYFTVRSDLGNNTISVVQSSALGTAYIEEMQ